MQSDNLADTVAEELLELTGKALLARDFEAFRAHFELPLRLETIDGHRFLKKEETLKEVFDSLINQMDCSGVEDFVRTVVFAEFIDPDTIRSVHLSSEIHKGGELKRASYPVHSTLVRRADSWKIVTCLYIIRDNPDRNRVFVDTSPKLEVR